MIHYSGQGPVMGSCAESNEHACYIRRREFLDQLSDKHVLKNECAPRT
jgi:hypothetical protein